MKRFINNDNKLIVMEGDETVLKELGNIAVLVVDIQNDFCHENGAFAKLGLDVSPAQAVTPRIRAFIDKVRDYDVSIIYSKQIESEEVTPKNLQKQLKRFNQGKIKGACAPGSWGSGLYKLKPAEGEHIVEKYTYDVFSNPQFKDILAQNRINTLVITGVNTDICIDTNIRRSFTEGYNIVIPKDLVATMNTKVQKDYLDVFDKFFGTVTDSKYILDYLKK